MNPNLKLSINEFFQEHNQKIWLGSTVLMQILGWLSENWVMILSLTASSLVPLYMSVRAQRQKQRFDEERFDQEMRQKQRMDDIAYEEALINLQKKKG